MVLKRQQLSLELQVAGQGGHGDGGAGVAVPLDELVIGRHSPGDIAQDVVDHLSSGLGIHLGLSLVSGLAGGGEGGQPLVVSAHHHLVVGRTEGGGYLGLSGVVVNAAHAPHRVTPDIKTVR